MVTVGRDARVVGFGRPEEFWAHLGTVREAVLKVVGDHYGLYGRVLVDDLELEADLGSDRLDKLEVLMTMEELFDIYFSECVPEAVVTVGDLIHAVEDALGPLASGHRSMRMNSR
jgi:acyl carrier protein